MKHIKLFENSDASSWNNLFRTIAKFAKPITKNQFIAWNEDISLPEEGWEAMIQFFIKRDFIDNKARIAKDLGEKSSQATAINLLELGLINWDEIPKMLDITWDDIPKMLGITIMVIEAETFPMDILMNQQIMNFYNYDIYNATNNDDAQTIYAYPESGLRIFANTLNNVQLCTIQIDSHKVICVASNFEKYLK